VISFLSRRLDACQAAGIAKSQIIIDPGFGFGKTLAQNMQLLRHLDHFKILGVPVLVGLSRKSMQGLLTGRPVEQRLAGSLALATLALMQGVQFIRTHDVAETIDVARIVYAFGEG